MKLPSWPTITENKPNYGLEGIKKVLELLGNPQNQLKNVFHVAGTNGKGSTTAFLKYMIEADGYKVNRFISPHLVNYNERIEICGKQITDEYYDSLSEEVKKVVDNNSLKISYFEGMTVIAFLAFSRSNADVNIIEVGLGGRLDATNVIQNPLVSIITSISYDHMHILGNTLEEIAMEKFGIAKKGVPVVISKQTETISDLLVNECIKIGSPYYVYNKQWKYIEHENNCVFEGIFKMLYTPYPTMEGDYQVINAGTAIAAIFAQNKLFVSDEAIRNGIKNMFWPARLQNISNSNLAKLCNCELYLDGSHNEDGAKKLVEWIDKKNTINKKDTILVLSILAKKDSKAFLKNISQSIKDIVIIEKKLNDHVFKKYDELKKEADEFGINVLKYFNDIQDALTYISKIKKYTRVIITGSLYFAGYVLESLD